MEISESRRGTILVVSPSGRMDSTTSPQFDRFMSAVIDRGDVNIVIDLSALEYISSTGLSVFLSSAKKIRRGDGRLALSGLNSRIRLAFEMSGFLRLFSVYPSVEAAIAG
ncbi:MAG TPA: STAS domain-containing protein [Rhizobiaceae bacterium]|nr:STAS domain-containing protein [Rhizobiaceae bacterium]